MTITFTVCAPSGDASPPPSTPEQCVARIGLSIGELRGVIKAGPELSGLSQGWIQDQLEELVARLTDEWRVLVKALRSKS